VASVKQFGSNLVLWLGPTSTGDARHTHCRQWLRKVLEQHNGNASAVRIQFKVLCTVGRLPVSHGNLFQVLLRIWAICSLCISGILILDASNVSRPGWNWSESRVALPDINNHIPQTIRRPGNSRNKNFRCRWSGLNQFWPLKPLPNHVTSDVCGRFKSRVSFLGTSKSQAMCHAVKCSFQMRQSHLIHGDIPIGISPYSLISVY
jgi:hypothetical protein